MRFMIIVKATADSEAGVMPPPPLLAQMGAFHEELARAGVLLDGAGLKASAHGWRVGIAADGQRRVLDGPFAETKEQLLGFYVVDCKNLDEALDVARDLGRVNPGGAYEIRPVGHFTPGSIEP